MIAVSTTVTDDVKAPRSEQSSGRRILRDLMEKKISLDELPRKNLSWSKLPLCCSQMVNGRLARRVILCCRFVRCSKASRVEWKRKGPVWGGVGKETRHDRLAAHNMIMSGAHGASALKQV